MAQLVARLVRIEEVRGSNPLRSTLSGPHPNLSMWRVSSYSRPGSAVLRHVDGLGSRSVNHQGFVLAMSVHSSDVS